MWKRTIGGVVSLVLCACGGPPLDELCEASNDCNGGNDKDLEACIAQGEYVEDVASEIGCTDELDEYLVCVEENAACESQSIGVACTDDSQCQDFGASCHNGECQAKIYGVDGDDCEVEERAFNRCFDF